MTLVATSATMPIPAAFETVGVFRAAGRRFRHALRPALVFAPTYSVAVTASVALHFVWREQGFTTRAGAVMALFALGGLIAAYLSWVIAATIAGHRHGSVRFAAMTAILTVGTAGITAFLFFLQFRVYYAQWHAPEFSFLWLIQTMFTGATSVFIFATSGLRLLLPFGLPVLFAGALVFARRKRG